MKNVVGVIAGGLLTAGMTVSAAPIELSFGLSVDSGSPEAAVGNSISGIIDNLTNAGALNANETELLTALELVRDNPDLGASALVAISPKSNSSNTSFIKKMPSFNHLQGLGKRLSALRKGTNSYRSFRRQNNRFSLLERLNNNGIEDGGLLDNRLSLFFTGDLLFAQQTETMTESGFSGNIARLSTGADYRLSNRLFTGAYASMFYGKLGLNDDQGQLSADEERLAVYASYFPFQNTYINIALGSALRHFDLQRQIVFTINSNDFERTATSSPAGNNLEGSAELGIDLPLPKGFMVNFNTKGGYSRSVIDGFTESGGGGFSLAVDEQTVDNITAGVGAQLSAVFSTSWSVLSPYIRSSYVHEFSNAGDNIRARFVYDPGNSYFSYSVKDSDSDYFDVAAGTTVIMAGGFSAFAQVSSLLMFDNFNRIAIVAGARSEF